MTTQKQKMNQFQIITFAKFARQGTPPRITSIGTQKLQNRLEFSRSLTYCPVIIEKEL